MHTMFSYVVALLGFLLFFYNPILEFLSPGAPPPQIRRMPRPQLNENLLALEATTSNQTLAECTPDTYAVHIFSRAPLVLYIENFLAQEERDHLLEIRYVPLLFTTTRTTR
jgi:prolyl 4-hydroxylase